MTTSDDTPLARSIGAARRALDDVDPAVPSAALPQLRLAAEHVSAALDAAMASAILEEGATIRTAGALAGLSENAVGPRLARTEDLGAYSADGGRVTAKGVERALYDLEQGRHQPAPAAASPAAPKPAAPLRFRARRPSRATPE
jgi:hypothetical protein